ncbi:alpha/beta hydrolase [Bosea sp. NPDC003192]|uniref:alpha/beta hydrolase n=1 Tax=Bosea sp. NPDC003192 TaxID=3390551 RepID=UPI003CFD1D3D
MTDRYIATGLRPPAPLRRLARVLGLLPLLVLATACATRQEDVLRPVPAAAEASRVEMLVVTTRQPDADPGLLYSGERGDAISFDSIQVSIPPDRSRKLGEIQWPARALPDPKREFAVLGVRRAPSERQILDWFRRNRNAKRQALIFVHGFNNTYADAVFRLAQLKHDAGITAAPILFTWPSRASVFDYLYDKESTTYSRRALEELIVQASRSPDVGEVTILAHSMGTWLTMEALRGVAMREGAIPAKVKDVVLASPDIDVDVFRRQMIEIGHKPPRFTILASTADRALEFSRWISGGVSRVGGADLGPYAEITKLLGIRVIDTSTATSADPLGHNAFADSPEMVAVLGRTLSGQSLQSDRADLIGQVGGVAIGTANLVGSAARAVASPSAALAVSEVRSIREQQSGLKQRISNGRLAY